MIENLGPMVGGLVVSGFGWFMFNGYYQEYKRSDNKAKTLATILPGTILVGLPILGSGVLLILWVLGFEFLR